MMTTGLMKITMGEIDNGCPDYDILTRACRTSTGGVVPNAQQQIRYCTSCDYDDCPVYLGSALRSSRAQGLDRESLVASGK